MPTPKISGNLYNCAFNCALPTLLEKIELLAQLEHAHQLPGNDDIVYINYKKIKNLFAQRYGLSGEESELFTWSQFNAFLLMHTFPAQEILFAPVFRLFIAESGRDIPIPEYELMRQFGAGDYDSLNPDRVPLQCGIDPNTGKYLQLDFSVMEKGFYHRFGIKVNLFLFNNSNKTYEANDQVDESYVIPESPLSRQNGLSLYLKGGHYELQPHNQVDLDAYFFKTGLFSGSFDEVFKATTEDMSASRTNEALARLFIYVNRKLNGALLSEVQNLQVYAQNGRGFYHPGQEGTLTFAVILLVIGVETSSEDLYLYVDYLRYIEILSDNHYEDAIVLANAIVDSQCNLRNLEQNEAIKSIIDNVVSIIASSLDSIPDDVSILKSTPDDVPIDEAPIDEAPIDEAPIDEAPIDEAPIDEAPIDEAPILSATSDDASIVLSSHVDLTANFQFNCMIGLAAAGALLLCVAIACPPAAAIALGVIGAVSLLASAGLFAYRQGAKECEPVEKQCYPS